MALSRGYRNNNPGNIRLTFDAKGNKTFWQGEIEGEDKSFKKFKSMAYGYRAMFVLLNTYMKNGFNTLVKIINRYAPAEDNNHPLSYINTVSNRSGVKPDEVLKQTDIEKLLKVVAGMSFVENGVSANITDVEKGYKLFKTV